jgi:hypothetical protein
MIGRSGFAATTNIRRASSERRRGRRVRGPRLGEGSPHDFDVRLRHRPRSISRRSPAFHAGRTTGVSNPHASSRSANAPGTRTGSEARGARGL